MPPVNQVIGLCLVSFDFFNQLRQDYVYITYDAIMSNGENRCLCILVDSDDDIAVLHAGQMLNSTADAAGKVDMRSNGFTGLANLLGVVSQPSS